MHNVPNVRNERYAYDEFMNFALEGNWYISRGGKTSRKPAYI